MNVIFRAGVCCLLTLVGCVAKGAELPNGPGQGRVAVEDFASAAKLAAQPPWDAWAKQETATVRSWMAQPRDNAALVAGWAHDLVDARTGAFLGWTPETPCVRFGTESSRGYRACVFMQRQHNIKLTLQAARLYRLTGAVEFADWAAAQLDMYQAIYSIPSSTQPASHGKLFLQKLDESTVSAALADTVRLLRSHVAVDRVNGWCQRLLLPMGQTMLDEQRDVHNIAVWYGVGAAITAMECGDKALLETAMIGKFGLRNMLEAGTSKDGFWFELSPQYQSYVATALTDLLTSASVRGQAQQFEDLWPYLHSLMFAPSAVSFGGEDGPTINDMNRQVAVPDLALVMRANRVMPTDIGMRESSKTPGWNELIDPVDNVIPLIYPKFDGAPAANWVTGLKSLYLKKDGWVALLRAGQGSKEHAHQDALSIELKFGDTWLFRNSVTPAYGSQLQRTYYKLAAAVSAPLVDSKGGSNWFKEVSEKSADSNGVSAEFESYSKGVNVTRALAVDRSAGFSDTVSFKTTAPGRRSLGVLYHTDCTLPAAVLEGPADVATPSGISVHITGWELIQANSSTKAITLHCGDHQFPVSVSGSRQFKIWRGVSPALAPARKRTAIFIELEPGEAGWVSSMFSQSR